VIVRNCSRIVSKEVGMDQVKIDAADCSRLLIESVELIKGLHMMGLSLECPIYYFMQVEYVGGRTKVKIPKILPSIS
jgi:hypothetical protein